MQFSRIPDPSLLPAKQRGGVVAIGNFDGVHRGHQAVLREALKVARTKAVPSVALTFEPHPRTFFQPDKPVFRLTDAFTKAAILSKLGFDVVVEQTFDADFASTQARDFVEGILHTAFGASHVVIGFDFHFGKGREGSPEFLQNVAQDYGFDTTVVEPFADEGGEVISSSRIRDCLGEGEISAANGLLGYAFTARGEVLHGKQLGRELGFPTANIALPANSPLKHGIYAVRTVCEDGVVRDGVASYGRRPTFDNGEVLLETYIFDFAGDIYGQTISVSIFGWIRGEEKFEAVQELVARMKQDAAEARAILSAVGSERGLWPIPQHD